MLLKPFLHLFKVRCREDNDRDEDSDDDDDAEVDERPKPGVSRSRTAPKSKKTPLVKQVFRFKLDRFLIKQGS